MTHKEQLLEQSLTALDDLEAQKKQLDASIKSTQHRIAQLVCEYPPGSRVVLLTRGRTRTFEVVEAFWAGRWGRDQREVHYGLRCRNVLKSGRLGALVDLAWYDLHGLKVPTKEAD